MDPKPRPNHALSIRILRGMTADQRLRTALDLSEHSRALFEDGLRRRHPELSEPDFHALLLDRLSKCHNRNY